MYKELRGHEGKDRCEEKEGGYGSTRVDFVDTHDAIYELITTQQQSPRTTAEEPVFGSGVSRSGARPGGRQCLSAAAATALA